MLSFGWPNRRKRQLCGNTNQMNRTHGRSMRVSTLVVDCSDLLLSGIASRLTRLSFNIGSTPTYEVGVQWVGQTRIIGQWIDRILLIFATVEHIIRVAGYQPGMRCLLRHHPFRSIALTLTWATTPSHFSHTLDAFDTREPPLVGLRLPRDFD